MSNLIRFFSRPRRLVEITQSTFQFRSLLRPSPRLNELIVGALAEAQERYPAQIHAFAFLSTHWHWLATFDDVEHMASFMRFFTAKLSKEVGILHDWKGSVFPERYRHFELSDEQEIEHARLKYVLSQGCKEGLVASPLDWPGVTSTEAMISGEPLRGVWVDRTALCVARSRGKQVSEADFTEERTLRLDPLPGLAHMSRQARALVVLDWVREIEQETAARHRSEGTSPVGVAAVLARDPHYRPEVEPSSSPRPWFHAWSKSAREALRTAFLYFLSAYRAAADRLKAGEADVQFPDYCFPPAMPFVRPIESRVPQ